MTDDSDNVPNARSPAAEPARSLIDEIEAAIARKDMRHQASVMRRVTDLFMRQGTGFSKEHVDMFDDVMCRLVLAIENAARAEFGRTLATLSDAPPNTTRILALDDAIDVAGPVLSRSECLDEEVLLEGARTKSQEHLLAISRRRSIAEAVTDVLVDRGDQRVVASTAANAGARFSEFGFCKLATRGKDDCEVARHVWLRDDIPRPHLLRLFADASATVRRELESVDRAKTELYRYMVAEAANQIQAKVREKSQGFAAAQERIRSLHQAGSLSEDHLREFALAKKFDETTIALSLMCDLPIGHIEQLIVHSHADQLLVLAKALEISWETTRAIMTMQAPTKGENREELEANCAGFMKLQPKTAQAALQFYRLRARAATTAAN